MRRLIPLVGILIFVWLSILLGTFAIARLVLVAFVPGSDPVSRIAAGVVRVVVAAGLALALLFLWKRLTDVYFWRALRGKS